MAASYYSYFGTPGAGGFRQSLPCETLVAAAGAAPGIPRAVGQASKTHMVLGILATQNNSGFPLQHWSRMSAMQPWCSFLKWEPSGDGAGGIDNTSLGWESPLYILMTFCINAATTLH